MRWTFLKTYRELLFFSNNSRIEFSIFGSMCLVQIGVWFWRGRRIADILLLISAAVVSRKIKRTSSGTSARTSGCSRTSRFHFRYEFRYFFGRFFAKKCQIQFTFFFYFLLRDYFTTNRWVKGTFWDYNLQYFLCTIYRQKKKQNIS